MSRLDEIEAREQATPAGPWRAQPDSTGRPLQEMDAWDEMMRQRYPRMPGAAWWEVGGGLIEFYIPGKGSDNQWEGQALAEFLAHAREDIPWLMADNERLRARVRELEAK